MSIPTSESESDYQDYSDISDEGQDTLDTLDTFVDSKGNMSTSTAEDLKKLRAALRQWAGKLNCMSDEKVSRYTTTNIMPGRR